MGAISIYMPKIFTMSSSFSMALLALRGTSGFVAKIMSFLGIYLNKKNHLFLK
jgi:NAD(P)H-quinone oxidoreductase subunit 4